MSRGFTHYFALTIGLCLASAQADVLPPQHYDFQTVPWGGGGYVDVFVYHPKAKNLLYTRTDVGGAFCGLGRAKRCRRPAQDRIGVRCMHIHGGALFACAR